MVTSNGHARLLFVFRLYSECLFSGPMKLPEMLLHRHPLYEKWAIDVIDTRVLFNMPQNTYTSTVDSGIPIHVSTVRLNKIKAPGYILQTVTR